MKTLQEYIEETFITEMAKDLSTYLDICENLVRQILQNWCLVRWCDNHEDHPKAVNRNHWASELKSHLLKLIDINIKVKNKLKNVKRLYITELELNDKGAVHTRIYDKFRNEGLGKYSYKVAEDCAEHINDICEVICGNEYKMIEYIKYPIGFGD